MNIVFLQALIINVKLILDYTKLLNQHIFVNLQIQNFVDRSQEIPHESN